MRFNHRNNRRARPSQRPGTVRPAGPTEHWAVAYAKANPLKIGTAAATLYGLLIIFNYRTYIEYDSPFDIQSLASVIFSAAYVGFLVLIGFSIGLFAPSYFIGAFCIDDQCRRTRHGVQRRAIQCFGIAFLAFAGWFEFVYLFGDMEWAPAAIAASPVVAYLVFALLRAPWSGLRQALDSGVGVARGAGSWITWAWRRMREVWRNVPAQYKAHLLLGFNMTVVCVVEVIALGVFFLLMRDSHFMQAKKIDWLEAADKALKVGMLIQIAGAYLVIAWRSPTIRRKHRVFATISVLLVPIFAPLLASEVTPVFSLTSLITKTGNFRAAEITLNDDGCRAAADMNRTLCVKTREGTNKLCNVHVMSRIGSETYLLLSYPELAAKKESAQQSDKKVEKINGRIVQHVYIPSVDILGIKPDLSVRIFTKEAIKNNLARTSSICELPKPEEPKPATSASFAEKDLFEFDDHSLTAEGKETLGAFAQRLVRENQGALSVDVTGHADQLGSPYHNLSLSQLRAITVANFLQSQLDGKVRTVKMSMQGVGSSRVEVPDAACPVSMKRAERIACFARNRRVDIVVTRL